MDNKSIRLEDGQVNYINRQTDNLNKWVRDAVDLKINRQQKLPDNMHKLGLYVQKLDVTQYIIRTLKKAKKEVVFDENSDDKGIISFRFSGLVGYHLEFYFHKIYLKHKDDFYQFEHRSENFYHDFSIDGYLNGDSLIDFSAQIVTKYLSKTIKDLKE